jgi:hypothetical protein
MSLIIITVAQHVARITVTKDNSPIQNSVHVTYLNLQWSYYPERWYLFQKGGNTASLLEWTWINYAFIAKGIYIALLSFALCKSYFTKSTSSFICKLSARVKEKGSLCLTNSFRPYI